MSEKENAEMVRRAHQAFKEGDQETVQELFAEDIVWRVPGRSQAATTDHGMEEVFENFGELVDLTEGTYAAEGTDYLGGEDHGIAMAHVTAERDGKELDLDEIVIFNIEDEKLTEAWHIPYDLYQWDEFFE
jgi:ketosteroid isomerase-like protein